MAKLTQHFSCIVLVAGLFRFPLLTVNANPLPNSLASVTNTDVTATWTREGLIGLGPRQEHSVAAINDTIYVVGGIVYDDVYLLGTTGRVESYNTSSKHWSVSASLLHPVNHCNLASTGGKLYSLGGLSGKTPDDREWLALPGCNAYDTLSDTWNPITPMRNGTERGSSAVGVHGSVIYLAGGMTKLSATQASTQDSVDLVSSYDTVTDEWNENYPRLPRPRQHVGGVVVNGVFYVIGGRENGVEKIHNTIFALDLNNPTKWVERQPMPTARGSLACSVLHDRYIACAGGEGNSASPLGIFPQTEMYDTATDTWTELLPMVVPRHGTAAVTVGNKMYVPGGGKATGAQGGTGGVFDYLSVEIR